MQCYPTLVDWLGEVNKELVPLGWILNSVYKGIGHRRRVEPCIPMARAPLGKLDIMSINDEKKHHNEGRPTLDGSPWKGYHES